MALSNHSFPVGQERRPALLLFVFFATSITVKFHVKLLALEDMLCLGLESISELFFFFFAAESAGNSGLDRLCGATYILTEGKNLFVPHGFLPRIISLQSKDNVDKGAFLHKVHFSDAHRHILHKLDKQAISKCVRPVGPDEDMVGKQARDEGVAL